MRNFLEDGENKAKWLVNVLESIYDGIVVVDIDSTIIYANPAYTRNFGVPVEKVLGKKLSEIEPSSRVLQVLESGIPIVDDPSHVKSVETDIMANITPILEGAKVAGAVAVFRDLTEVQNLEKKLQEAKKEMEKTKNLTKRFYSELQEIRSYLLEVDQIVCESPEMRKLIELVLRISKVDSTVLLTGESGVGKEVVAKLIHKNSNRAGGPFVIINCGAIPENLLESELFGYKKGSFTGAGKEGKLGLVELADSGTLFLDEIGELPLKLQVKLLRVIQERSFLPVGSMDPVKADVRFIAATNRDLKQMVKEKTFREDLFFRLNVVPIHIPPLRERKEDIVPLIKHFLNKINEKYDIKKKIVPEALRFLENYSWPGNVRELENMIERLVVFSSREFITLDDIMKNKDLTITSTSKNPIQVNELMSLQDAKDILERELVAKALVVAGNMRKAGSILGVNHSTISRKAKRHKIEIDSK